MNESIYTDIAAIQKEIEQNRAKILELRKQLAPEPVADYTFKDRTGKDVKLSDLFDERDELMVIHNMGKKCSYCTLWADGINGFTEQYQNRMPFVLVSPDSPEVQREISSTRGWRFNMVSAAENTFTADLGFEPKPKMYYPGVSALIRKDSQIYRVSYDQFGPGDAYCSIWHLFDLFPKRDNEFEPR